MAAPPPCGVFVVHRILRGVYRLRKASFVSGPAPLNAEWCRAAPNPMRTVIRSCRSHERSRRSLLRLAEPASRSAIIGPTLKVSAKKKHKEHVALGHRRLVVAVVVVVRTWYMTCVSVHARQCHALIKTDRRQCACPASALVPSTGLTSRKKPYALSLRVQVPGVPRCKITQPQGEEKDCEARPPFSPLLRRKGCAIFSISSSLDALDLD